jgi:hypothetical protein
MYNASSEEEETVNTIYTSPPPCSPPSLLLLLVVSSTDMYNNDVGQESAQKFMKQTGDLKAATLYFAS